MYLMHFLRYVTVWMYMLCIVELYLTYILSFGLYVIKLVIFIKSQNTSNGPKQAISVVLQLLLLNFIQ